MIDCKVRKIDLETWKKIAENAQMVSFGEKGHAELSTVDYAIIGASDDEIFAFATVIEMDKDTAHLQHGGAMPNILGTRSVKLVYHEIIEWLKMRYKRITTRIKNTNTAMLKLAMSEGLLVSGISYYKDGGIYLQLDWGF